MVRAALCMVMLACSAASAGTGFCPESLCYYDEFNSKNVPWKPAPERNLEEVFKNYRYFTIRYTGGGTRLEVTEYLRGEVAGITWWRIDEQGELKPVNSRLPADKLYARHCAGCHGESRLGVTGPALLPDNLRRLRRAAAADVIANGRPATQMPGFAGLLEKHAIEALVAWIYERPEISPPWGEKEIRASHVLYHPPASLSGHPKFDADPLNLFMVVESGDHHVTVLDGDSFEPLHRFPTRYALHGGIKYSPDGRFAYLASRDGWISKFDLYNLATVAEIRAGINTRNIAVSGDGRTVLAGNYLPETLVLLHADDLSLQRVIPVQGVSGQASRVSAVYQAAPRSSFIVALKDVPEVWEIPADGRFAVRRIRLDSVLDDFMFDDDYSLLIGADRAHHGGQVIDLDSGARIARLSLSGMPHLGSGITWEYRGEPVLATPNLEQGSVTVISMRDWRVIREIETLGPGFFMRSHENSRYAWTDVFFGEHRDAIHVIDKDTLEISRTLRPEPGKTSAHVEFTRDGRFALVSLWEQDGSLIVYDAETLEEVKRIPMKKPSGKYNVYNKITRSSGTSH